MSPYTTTSQRAFQATGLQLCEPVKATRKATRMLPACRSMRFAYMWWKHAGLAHVGDPHASTGDPHASAGDPHATICARMLL